MTTPDASARWADAGLAAALVAVDPAGLGGAALQARHGPVRTRWLDALTALWPEGAPLRRIPASVGEERLLGGLDLGATLSAGRPVAARGVLAEADGGAVVLPMAERAEPATVAVLCAALDTGRVRAEREGVSIETPARIAVVALDEAAEGEDGIDPALADRLAFSPRLEGLPVAVATPFAFSRADVAAARARLAVADAGALAEPLTTAAVALGIASLRAPILALRAARAAMALLGPAIDAAGAGEIAARLVLAHRATRLPAAEEEEEEDESPPPEPPPESEGETDDAPQSDTGALADRVLEAAASALPEGLLAALAAQGARRQSQSAGKAGARRRAPDRGRPLPSRPGQVGAGRIDVAATLRAAAPWQTLRRAPAAGRVAIRTEDVRLKRFRRQSASATIFLVDASGSAAAARLAEAKGAVEILLAEAYVRRDKVALIAFRGERAELLLPPTAAPALAKRRLAALPGGGGTPLAAGLEAGLSLGLRLLADGVSPTLMVLTDGRANIARDGRPDRAAAREDAAQVARLIRAAGLPAMVIDTGARPRAEAETLARDLGGRYLALPRAEARRLGQAAAGLAAASG